MGILDRLFGGNEDATKAWPPSSGPCPQISLERQALETFGGKIVFGDPVENARFLGRPDDRTVHANFATLGYPQWGLTLEFELGRFVEATFDLDRPPASQPDNPFATQVKGPDGVALTQQTSKHELLRRFGEPAKTQDLDDETILYYHHGPLVSEFDVREDGLFAWSVYLDK